MLKNNISTTKVSEILYEEFMLPLNISAYAVAKAINVPSSRILDILHDKRKITVDTSIRLGKLFGVSPKYFLNIQNDIELRNAEIEHSGSYNQIKQLSLA
ncbi:HigA family addiction module antidote protein [Lactobacillus sp. PV037]|uniref:HigA family addiction module antitoxin n=1 Tax=unclassified Lactobacillus TaxID=2620435 RepID=UPI0022407D85|nr:MULTISPECIES: HigA family addiction module antitoxin [unclassified Lactobacillus]QNQ82272.1 HigA family addiction module antidote protein [Lactobacillus sp. PV012]QNQ83617.1 HigA family addiction module antidote protein [Lactobacillus sp. PV037]